MKKVLFVLCLVLVSALLNAQTCPLNCGSSDSLAYTATKDTLILSAGWTAVSWVVKNGPPGVAVNAAGTSVTGLQPGTTTVLQLLASNGSFYGATTKIVTVASAPVPPPICPPVSISSATYNGSHVVLTLSTGQVLSL